MRAGERVAGRFEIEAEIGAGGMGAVFRARDRASGQLVAVKVLRTAGEGERRFVREALALAELRHPGIVRYIDHGETAEGESYLVMEWLAGASLEEHLLAGPLAIEECISVVSQVSQALAVAHRRGIVHRDIKPGNLVIDLQGVAKIVDFGVVRLRDHDPLVTQAGVMMGTPAYMAPEQARGERDLDVRADVFALGVVLYECLTGVSPFSAEHLMAVLAKVLLEEVRRVEELRPEVPPALAELVHSMLCKDAAGRPADAMEVAIALAELPLREPAQRVLPRQRRALILREQRLVSVILVAADDAPDPGGDTYDGLALQGFAPTMSEGGERLQIDDVRRAAKAHGGEVELLADRSMLVTIGTGGAATDQAASAALCALALRAVLEGVVIVLAMASGEAGGRRPFAAALDRAVAVLGGVIGSAGIYLDEVTAGLLDERFSLEEVGRGARRSVHLRGEILRDKPTRMLMGSPTPCVGRRRELQILETIFEEAEEECTAQAVLVTAPPGLGKSRLRYEFVDRLRKGRRQQVVIWTARCDPTGVGSPFGLVARLLRSAFGIRDGEPEVSFSVLQEGVAAALPEPDRQRVTAFLGELCGTPSPAGAGVQLLAARRDPQVMADQLGRAWEDFIGAVSAGGTLLLILEDLQWGDVPSVALLDRALRHLERPMMVLALARPEVHEVFPRLWAGRGITEIQLRPLSRRACRALIVEVLGDADEALCARMIEQAAGNALYLEELIRSAADGKGEVPPGSVLAMLQARLQRLDAGARKVLRAASVFGQVFWEGGVRVLLGDEAELCTRWLDTLVEDEVISARTTRHFVDENEYIFHHDLLRAAAYETLTADDRSLAHLYAGEWLERHGERDPVALALHFERGGEMARAVAYFVQAAVQAVEGNDFAAAIEHAEHGISCGAEGQERGRLLLQSAVARHWRGDYAEAQADASEATLRLARGSAQWYEAASVLMTTAGSRADHEVLARTVAALRAATPEPGSCAERLIAAAHAVVQLNHTGRYDLAESLLTWTRARATDELASEPQVVGWIERAAFMRAASNLEPGPLLLAGDASTAAFTAAGDLRMACYQGMNLGYGKIVVGLYEEANEVLESAAVMARRLHLEHLFASIDSYLGYSLGLGGALHEGIARLRTSIGELRREGIQRMEMRARNYLALLLTTDGQRIEAMAMIREAIAISDSLPATRALLETTAAHIAVLEGRIGEALEGTRSLLDLLARQGSIEDGEPLLRLTHARALLLSGAVDEAREAVNGAYRAIVMRARTIEDRAVRESFLSRVLVNAWTVALYRELGGELLS